MQPVSLFVSAAMLALARALAPLVSFSTGGQSVSLGEAHGLCASGLGEWAQALSQSAASDCGHVALVYDALNLTMLTAVGCLVWGLLLLVMRPSS